MRRRATAQHGVTLVELVIVVAIIGMIAAVAFPAVTAGIESIRLHSAADSIAGFLNAAMNRADRRQEVIQVAISPKNNVIRLHSTEPGFERKLEMPPGVSIETVLPQLPGQDAEERSADRSFLLLPGGTVPRVGIQIVNGKGTRRVIRIDPITGVPQIETVGAE